ncbi:MAG: AAA family ATP:ADP antiporter [Halioglobus sp.]|jgi:AAA family ATP:ADP antiporter
MTEPSPSSVQRLLNGAFNIRADEIKTTLLSFLLILFLMTAYYLLRPVRDAMASDWSDAEVSWLWTLTFFFSAIAVSFYGIAVTKITFSRLIPTVYGFFALSFTLFYVGTQYLGDRVLLDKSFYVWLSVFSLFHVSVFWSFMSDLYSQPQAIRLFAFIGAGASAGGIIGPAIASLLVKDIGTDQLLLIASALLLATLPGIGWLQSLKSNSLMGPKFTPKDTITAIGGSPFAGFSALLSSRFLLGICVFILLYTSISSFVYFELKNLLAHYTRNERSQIWSNMDLVVNSLTLLVALFATGRIARRWGLSITLASVPVLIAAGLLFLAAAPMVAVVVALQIVRRTGNYAITRPAREMLFTAVDRETRFKAKPVIDIVVYRGGDMLNAWAFTALTQGLGLGLAAVAGVGAGIAALWAIVGIYLGRQFHALQPDEDGPQ